MEKMPSQEYLLRCFLYDPVDGSLSWKYRPFHHFKTERAFLIWNARWSSTSALNCVGKNGYKHGSLNGKRVYAHRVIYKLLNGDEPEVIDHENGNKLDNRMDNLKNGDISKNMKNQKQHTKNTSGVTGVTWNKRNKKWQAQISNAGKNQFLGSYDNFEDAVVVRKNAERTLGYNPRHGRTN